MTDAEKAAVYWDRKIYPVVWAGADLPPETVASLCQTYVRGALSNPYALTEIGAWFAEYEAEMSAEGEARC